MGVGSGGTGTLAISGGGQVSCANGYVGHGYQSAVGSVTVDGTGSKWTNAGGLFVGNYGSGTLAITSGGLVSNVKAYVGAYSGSTGSVTVSGNGSTWASTGSLYLGGIESGAGGTGSVTVSNGGLVSTAGTLKFWNTGTLTINGGTLNAPSFDISAGGTLNFYDGALNVTGGTFAWSSTTLTINGNSYTALPSLTLHGVTPSATYANITVGNTYKGRLTISGGTQLASSGNAYIGNNSGSTGSVTVDGTGSTWTSSGGLLVGNSGSGSLAITGGGQVSSTYAYVGASGGSTGSVTVSGSGSTWASADSLYIGGIESEARGTGNVTVSSGGLVSAAGTLKLWNTSTLTINGGTVSTPSFDNSAGGTLNFYDGALNVTGGTFAWNSTTLTINGNSSTVLPSLTLHGVTPSDTYGNITVGHTSKGSLTISGGTQLASSGNAYIGSNSGSTGSVTVAGAGSMWTSSSDLRVGNSGSGTLSITGGGQVSNICAYVGFETGSTGTVTVDGSGSMWTSSSDLLVGNCGSGTLSITGGGQVANMQSWIGRRSGSIGSVTVDGAGSAWANAFNLYVGGDGTGALSITSGGLVSNSDGYVGSTSGSSGSVTVSGSGSTWSNTGNLNVGGSNFGAGGMGSVAVSGNGLLRVSGTLNVWGTGQVSVADGGQVASTDVYIGNTPAMPALVTVTGANSQWTSSGSLYVGYVGDGTMAISDGGQVSSANANVGYGSGSMGAVTISGMGSTWSTMGLFVAGNNSGASGTGSVTVSDNGLLSVSGMLTLGGAGQVSVVNGGQVVSSDTYVGSTSGATATVAVTGTNSQWTNSGPLYVGYTGNGSLSIADGGHVSTANVWLGQYSGTTGSVTVDGTGSTWTNSGSVYVGNEGSGSLSITGGGQVVSSDTHVGSTSGATATVAVTGTNSQWTNSGPLYLGAVGNGSLTITGGGHVSTANVWLGQYSGTTGSVTVDGTGSTWINSGSVYVGNEGSGSLSITGGGQVASYNAYVGGGAGSTGSVTVDGANSQWIIGWVSVGYWGTGTLAITAGGQVSSIVGYVGQNSGSTGSVTVDGIGSTWTNSSGLLIGGDWFSGNGGSGSLSVTGDGQASVAGTLKLWNTGTLTINRGTVSVQSFDNSAGGTLNFYDGALNVSGGTLAWNGTNLTIDGNNSTALPSLTLHGVTSNANYDNITVGNTYQGRLTFSGGTQLASSGDICIGNSNGSTGSVTVDDAGSTLISFGNLSVGSHGSGMLAITTGGHVSDMYSFIGDSSGSTGTVTVDGANSHWTNSAGLSVGQAGSGTLSITDGGQVSNVAAYVGACSGSTGNVTVSGNGSIWSNTGSLYLGGIESGARGNGSVTVSNGGLVITLGSLHLWSTGTLSVNGGVVGIAGDLVANASMAITGGGQVTETLAYVGDETHSTGSVTVDGTNSMWASSAELFLGNHGNGTLAITGGARVSNRKAYVGAYSGSTGSVTVSGNGSTWASTGSLYLGGIESGAGGTGSVTVSNGGLVSTAGTLKLWSTSTLTINGGTVSTPSFDNSAGGTLNFYDGALNVSGGSFAWNSTTLTIDGNSSTSLPSLTLQGVTPSATYSSIRVGATHKGSLTISGGTQLTTSELSYVGLNSGSTGTVIVDGTGSKWTYSKGIRVARNSTLSITNGGQVLDYSYNYDEIDLRGGAISIDGANSRWTHYYEFWLSGGTVSVSNGGELRVVFGGLEVGPSYMGSYGNSVTVAVDGPGSKLNVGRTSLSPQVGDALVSITNGAEATSVLSMTAIHGTTAKVIVDGIGSTWSGGCTIGGYGSEGDCTLAITGAGHVSGLYASVGFAPGSTGRVTVDGTNSTWTNSSALFMGEYGNGSLSITDGGQVSNFEAYLGAYSGSTGNVTVSGSGSTWTSTGNVFMGGTETAAGGVGSVTVSNGGLVSTPGTLHLWSTGSLTVNGGSVTAGAITGAGSVRITNPTGGVALTVGASTSETFSGNLTDHLGAGSVRKVGSGTWTLTGNNRYSGATLIAEGCIRLGSNTALSPNSAVTVTSTADRGLDLAGFNATAGSLAGTGNVGSSSGTPTLTVGNGNTVTFSGKILDDIHLTKAGSGTWILTGNNSYSGGTTVAEGTLVAGSSTALGLGTVYVESGAMLKIADGITIANRISIAQQGTFVTTGTATVSLEAGATLSGITLDSGLSAGTTAKILGGMASSDLNLTASWTESINQPSAGATYAAVLGLTGTGTGTFVLQMSYDGETIQAAGLDELLLVLGWLDASSGKWVSAVAGNTGGTVTAYTGAYDASTMNQLGAYGVDTDNNVVWAVINHNSQFSVMAVPEPSTVALLLGAVVGLGFWRYRRRRSLPAPLEPYFDETAGREA